MKFEYVLNEINLRLQNTAMQHQFHLLHNNQEEHLDGCGPSQLNFL